MKRKPVYSLDLKTTRRYFVPSPGFQYGEKSRRGRVLSFYYDLVWTVNTTCVTREPSQTMRVRWIHHTLVVEAAWLWPRPLTCCRYSGTWCHGGCRWEYFVLLLYSAVHTDTCTFDSLCINVTLVYARVFKPVDLTTTQTFTLTVFGRRLACISVI